MNNTRKFVFNEEFPPIVYRPGTSDEAIIQTVLVEKKEYLFPLFDPKLVWDVGSNIGVVSVILANVYPDAKILAFEPVNENFELLKINTSHYKNVECFRYGLGNHTGAAHIFKSKDPQNLGGFSTFIGDEKQEEISILKASTACRGYGTPDLIKIDCEGSEHDILTDIEHLDRVKWITGELHGVKEYELLEVLNKHFKLQLQRGYEDVVWHFSAVSRGWTDFGRDVTPR